MNAPEDKLARIRGSAPEKRPTVRVLSAAAAHSDCAFAMLALAARADLDKLCGGTYYEPAFGQDPQAFQRGQMFERRVKDTSYSALFQLLRDKAGFPRTDVRTHDLRSRAQPNLEGLKQRAIETRRLLKQIARNAKDAPNVIDGAVLTCTVAGQTAYYEADSLAAATGGAMHVVEVKSFPYTDGRCDNEKLGSACDQAAWYAMLCRRALVEDGLPSNIVSDEGFIILPEGIGLKPTLLRQNLAAKIKRATQILEKAPNPADLLRQLSADVIFPDLKLDPDARVQKLEQLLDTVGNHYRPDCLQDCGMARLCRSRAQEAGLPSLCGSAVVRQLPGIAALPRAAELAQGRPPGSNEVHVATALARAGAVYERALKRGQL